MFNVYPYLNENDLNLDWIIKHFKEFIDEIADLNSWRQTHEQEYAELKAFMDRLNRGELPAAMYEEMWRWFHDNAFGLVGEMVKHVYFGLNDAGYFVVNIPQQWRDLIFNTTGYDIDLALQPEFGHLTISY